MPSEPKITTALRLPALPPAPALPTAPPPPRPPLLLLLLLELLLLLLLLLMLTLPAVTASGSEELKAPLAGLLSVNINGNVPQLKPEPAS